MHASVPTKERNRSGGVIINQLINQDDGNTPCGKWDDGTDQYFCIHHNKLVGHASKDCRLARGKTDNKYQPYPNRDASRTPSATFVRETMAAAMPQFAKQLLNANIDKGLVLTFERTTTATGVEALRKAMPGLGLMYNHATTIIVETRTEEERTTIEKRLQGAQDHGKTITITRHDKEQPAEQKGPIQFGDPPPLQFGPAATTPSPTTASSGQPTPTPPGDGPTPMDTGSSAPSEGSTQPAATPMAPHTPGLDARMTTMENRMGDIEVRVNGMDGKLDQLIANSGGKRKAIVRARANGSDMPDSYTTGAVTTKPTPDTVHSPTPGQLHVESIQLACTCALCCCYALCMKRGELLIFYSFWLRCFVVMMQYVGFLGRSQLFGSQVKVGAPTW